MASKRLNFGKLIASAVYKNGDNSFIRINGDLTSGSATMTSCVNNAGGNVNFSEALIGQNITVTTYLPDGATITNISGTTLTLDTQSSGSVSSTLGRISPASDSYYVASGSLTVPSNDSWRLTDVTGSDNGDWTTGDNTYGLIFPVASTSSVSTQIFGEYAQLKITKTGSRTSNVDVSFYISASSDGVNGEPTGRTQLSSNTTYAIVEQSVSESLAPIFSAADVSINTGYALSGYGIAVDTAFDNFNSGSASTINRTGSFTGSFTGSLSSALTDGNGISDFSFNGSSAATVAVQVSGSTLDVGTSGVRVADSGITAGQISSSAVSSSGAMFGGGGTKLGVQVDGNTIEISSGQLKVKTGGLPTSSLATSSFTLGTNVITLGDTATTINKLTLTETTASGQFSGSFSGSFQGDGSGLTGIASTLMYTASLGSGSVNLKTQALNILAGEGIDTSGSNQTLTISGEDATTTNKGIASFNSSDFQVSSGDVTLADSLSVATMSISQDLTVGLDATIGNDLTVTQNATIQGNLVVQGTASFHHEDTLDVADRFIRLASGSTSNGDGGIAIQQTSATNTELFGYDYNANRWGVTSSFDPGAGSGFTPKSFMAAVANNNSISGSATFQAAGNIYIDGGGEIYIYS